MNDFELTPGFFEHTATIATPRAFVGETITHGRFSAYYQRYRIESIADGNAQLRAVFSRSLGPDAEGYYTSELCYLDGSKVAA